MTRRCGVADRSARASAGDAGDKPASLAADGVRQQMAVISGESSGLITTALHPFARPLAAFEYGGVCHVEHSGDSPNAKTLLS
jgi:hypothetical protein